VLMKNRRKWAVGNDRSASNLIIGCPRGDRSRRIAKLQGKWSIGDPALKGFPVMDLLNSSRFILLHFCCLLTDDHFSDGKRKIHWCGSQKSWAWNKEAMGTVA
jgi:hypothetical protein